MLMAVVAALVAPVVVMVMVVLGLVRAVQRDYGQVRLP